MFEKFSFKQAAVAHDSSTASTANSTAVSPTSTRSSSPSLHPSGSSSVSILELSRQFSEHSIDQYLQSASVQRPLHQVSAESSTSHSYDSNSSSMRSSRSSGSSRSSFSSLLPSTAHYSELSPKAIRLQRQVHTRMQADNTHLRDISTLVQKMISDGDQCMVCTSSSDDPAVAAMTTASRSTTPTAADSASASDTGTNDENTRSLLGKGHKRAASAVLPYAVKHRKSGNMGNSHVSRTMRVRKQASDRVIHRSR